MSVEREFEAWKRLTDHSDETGLDVSVPEWEDPTLTKLWAYGEAIDLEGLILIRDGLNHRIRELGGSDGSTTPQAQ